MGFTIEEILILLEGFEIDIPQASQWRSMAETKIKEIDNLIQKFIKMKAILEMGLQCKFLSWDECSKNLSEDTRG